MINVTSPVIKPRFVVNHNFWFIKVNLSFYAQPEHHSMHVKIRAARCSNVLTKYCCVSAHKYHKYQQKEDIMISWQKIGSSQKNLRKIFNSGLYKLTRFNYLNYHYFVEGVSNILLVLGQSAMCFGLSVCTRIGWMVFRLWTLLSSAASVF